VEVKFTRELSLTSRLNIQKGTEEMENGDKSPSRHAPPTFGQTRLEFKKENWWLMLYSDYSGGFSFEQLPLEERGKPELYAVDANGNPYSPSWATINLKGYWKINKLLSTSLGFENLTDVRYRTYSSGIAAPGRNFILSLMANF
jgi:hemoglobin/transferrin/lactoferrin receptor protein